MEIRTGAQTPYEVYCHPCRVTFPVGTRQCIHCGRPIGTTGAPGAQPVGRGPAAPEDVLHEPQDPLNMARKLGGVSLWVLIAVGAAISRL